MSFGDMVKKVAKDSIAVMRGGEKTSAQAVLGKADLTDVVEAVTQAELTLQTVMAVRDRLLNAYQEIMRMPI
ncbi:MAG: flagellar hook-basal body complex protein FliE [Alphaproteobacteria bacterium]|nr:flagellar hook-basal body complex protein FliE [Alphaproteobacteria bacterium]